MTLRSLTLAAMGLALMGTASAVDFNGVKIIERAWNNSPSSVLTTTNNYPSLIQFDESFSVAGGFANQHRWLLSTDGGATAYGWQVGTPIDISMTVNLTTNNTALNSEAGFYADKFGDSKFLVRADGGVVAFGGAFNFFDWGTVYTPGTDAVLRVKYDGAGQVEMFFNGISSGVLPPGYGEGYWLDGMVFGGYAQHLVGAGHDVTTTFSNITIGAVPEPATMIALGAGLLGVLARRRRKS
jgi:hypothetical protein